ncbi:MBL fold metallo-hydrolase [Oerskovia sp. Sa1BUA8]|uniref:MBL fold metallo-hydrolase n=1 Tax=Oerskovia douganii TaxID=2762210 RepID=A0A9D5UAK9_9CELL|nr:MBL fold metallo-hydrolase [Oerskovia douganii]MBE7701000.1 MBL fold metallo-hydrolase [Oerskovia douganii]
MRITSHGHSCVALDHAGTTLTLDPGTFADTATALDAPGTLLVTHAHPDHLDVEAVQAALDRDPEVRVIGPQAVFDRLGRTPDDARFVLVEPGDVLTVGSFSVLVGGGQHALIHPDVPRVANLTYLVAAGGVRVYHPGDSFSPPLTDDRLDVLFAPVSAPWMKVAEGIDFVRSLDPWTVVPIHEAILSQAGLGLVHRLFGEARTGGTYDFRPLGVGERYDATPQHLTEETAMGEDPTPDGPLHRDPEAVAEAILREHPEFDQVPAIEIDETVPPRPEEEAADAAREEGATGAGVAP